MELINILIRTSSRAELFKRCLDSVILQSYKNVRIIIGYDNETALSYIPEWRERVFVSADKSFPYFYDLYCNDLKQLVNDGWFFYLDDDDYLLPDVLKNIPLTNPAILVQLNHMGNIVPASESFGFGQVGMPCLILHHTLKNIAFLSGNDHGDYHYIKEIQDKVGLTFYPIVMVESDRRGLGK